MNRRRLAGLAVALTVLTFVSLAASTANATQSHGSHGAHACKHGGWTALADQGGRPFSSQGRCIAWHIRHRRHQQAPGLADLTGSFDGTTEFTFQTGGCAFVHQTFDATYGGSTAVGNVTFHMEGCVDLNVPAFAGTFTMSTGSGDVSGSASGSVNMLPGTGPFADLTATATSGTGAFAGTAGDLRIVIEWGGMPSTSITGTLSLP